MDPIFRVRRLLYPASLGLLQTSDSFRPRHVRPPHKGLQSLRCSFIRGVSLERIVAGAGGARKEKTAFAAVFPVKRRSGSV